MSTFSRRYQTYILLFAVVLGGGVLYYVSLQNDTIYSDSDPAYNREFWNQKIEQQGGERSYELFKEYNAKAPEDRTHFAAHVFGEVLFGHLGTNGIIVCDSSFGFGCYHGFSARAISIGGTETIRELDSICVDIYGPLGTGCQHGIGHGILEYTGYQDIGKALALCTLTTQLVPLLGCTSGIFMELKTPSSETENPERLQALQRFDPAHPYDPCPSVPGEYQASCYYEIGKWFRTQATMEYQQLCENLLGSARHHCFLGIGSASVYSKNYSVAETLAECAQFANDDEFSCKAGASWAFVSTPEYKQEARRLCSYSDPGRTSECLMRADLTQGLDPHLYEI